MNDRRVDIIGVPISAVNMGSALQRIAGFVRNKTYGYICISNVHTTVMAHDNAQYHAVQSQSLMSLPDGKPLSVVGRKRCPDMDRVKGPDLMRRILERSAQEGYSHFFYGNTAENLERFISHVKEQYPGLKIAGYEPSVFRDLSQAEEDALCKTINDSAPDFCWVALGAPRQEIFCAKLTGRVQSLMIGVGGAFNVLAGLIPDAPLWMQKISLEWLYRMLQEPKRLFKRYATTNTKFLYYLLKERFEKH